jgi:hypothetical protein
MRRCILVGDGEKSQVRSSRRYFARIGIFQHLSMYNDALVQQKSNLYKYVQTCLFYRIQMRYGCTGTIDNRFDQSSMFVSKFASCKDRDNSPFLREWWGSKSTFIIEYYTARFRRRYFLRQTATFDQRRPVLASLDMHYYVSYSRRGLKSPHYACMLLPWFDRFDRMIFEKCLTEFHSSKIEFHSSKIEFYSDWPVLCVFIHQYL